VDSPKLKNQNNTKMRILALKTHAIFLINRNLLSMQTVYKTVFHKMNKIKYR